MTHLVCEAQQQAASPCFAVPYSVEHCRAKAVGIRNLELAAEGNCSDSEQPVLSFELQRFVLNFGQQMNPEAMTFALPRKPSGPYITGNFRVAS